MVRKSVHETSAGRRLSPRRAALEVLLRHRRTGRFVDDVLAEGAPRNLSAADRALLTALVYGTVRHRRTLDHLVAAFSSRDRSRIHPTIGEILRLGYFQILYLRRVPDYAACDESVELAGAVNRRSAGFVNAVMRGLLRGIEKKPAPTGPEARFLPTPDGQGVLFGRDMFPKCGENPVSALGILHSYPDWLVARWIKQHGRDMASEICRAGNAPMPLSIRVNRIRGTVAEVRTELLQGGVESRPGGQPWSLALESPGDLTRLSGFRAGRFQVQDDTAMRAVAALEPVDGERILDACASPGGKTSHLKEEAPGSKVAACDMSPEKLSRVGETCSRLGHAGVRLICADMARPAFKRDCFDAILLDAPCSNTGVLARRPDARWRIRPKDLEALSALQGRLLSASLDLLKPGGRLVYSTCSIEPEENEHVVQKTLQERPRWRLEDTELTLPTSQAGGGFYARIGRP